jgi:hypothetical protein
MGFFFRKILKPDPKLISGGIFLPLFIDEGTRSSGFKSSRNISSNHRPTSDLLRTDVTRYWNVGCEISLF